MDHTHGPHADVAHTHPLASFTTSSLRYFAARRDATGAAWVPHRDPYAAVHPLHGRTASPRCVVALSLLSNEVAHTDPTGSDGANERSSEVTIKHSITQGPPDVTTQRGRGVARQRSIAGVPLTSKGAQLYTHRAPRSRSLRQHAELGCECGGGGWGRGGGRVRDTRSGHVGVDAGGSEAHT